MKLRGIEIQHSGLGIVKDIANLYGGTLKLGRSALGGLLAELNLPAA